MKFCKSILICFAIVVSIVACESRVIDSQNARSVSYEDLLLELPVYLSNTYQDTVWVTEAGTDENGNVYSYYMNRDTIYYGQKEGFFQKMKYPKDLNVYVEISNFIDEGDGTSGYIDRFLESEKTISKWEVWKKNERSISISNKSEFHSKEIICNDDDCYLIYYHAFNYGDTIDVDYHKKESNLVKNSLKFK